MSTIYIVYADNGLEYEDYTEWPIKAFVDKEKAEKFINNISQEINNAILPGGLLPYNFNSSYTTVPPPYGRIWTYEIELED